MESLSLINPAVSVVIPCRNERERIRDCLLSVFRQTEPEGGYEIIVADGMSDDGTSEILRSFVANEPRLRVMRNSQKTTPAGLNVAIQAARGEVVVRLDAHTEYDPDYLHLCVTTLKETRTDNVGGPARTKADTYMQEAVAAAYHSPFSAGGARFHNVDYEGYVDTVTYGCWRREAFERFGLFDEELIRNQDDEHNLRIVRGGGKIWQSPKIKSWYRPRGSLTALFKQYMQYGFWKVRVIQKHNIPASWRHLVPGAFVLSLLLLLLLLPFSTYAMPLLLSSIAIYYVAAIVASIHTASKAGWRLFPVLPVVFACYHFGYGYGFLRGVWDFLICRRRGPKPAFQTLTR